MELPEVRPRWRRYLFQSGYCAACKERVRSRHPEQVSLATGSAGVVVGPRAKALAADLKHRLGVPYRKTCELFRSAFGLEVTASPLCQAERRLARKAEGAYAEIAEQLASSAAVHADETGWRIAGESACLSDPDNARLARRLRVQRRHLFTFLYLDAVEATNNRAERMLRPAVITRKTGGCSRSPPGARAHEVLASMLVTLRQQGRDLLGYLHAVLTAPGPVPSLLPAPTTQSG